jgi:hypothetical protein
VAASKVNIGSVLKGIGKKNETKQMFTEAAGIHRKVLGAYHPLTKQSLSDRLIGCTVESKYQQVVLLNKEMIFEHDDRNLDTYL